MKVSHLNWPNRQTKSTAFYAWVVLFMSASFLFYKYVLQVSPSVMAQALMQHFHINGTGLGNLAATFFYAYLIAQLFVGPLLDKYNPRLLTAIAISISAMGACIFASSETLFTAALGRALVGVGAAFATVSYMKMVAIWFKPQQFAFVAGLLATAAMVGSIAGQAPLALLVDHLGWRSSLFYCGAAGFVLAVMYLLLVKNNHATLGNKVAINNKINLTAFVKLLQQKHNWLLMLYSGLAFSPVAVFGGLWGTPFLQQAHHLTKPEAASLTSLIFLGLAIGGPVLGFISDRLNNRFVIMWLGLLLSLVSLTVALYLPGLSNLFTGINLFLFGFGTGAFMLGFALAKELNPLPLAATVVGLINTGDALFGAFSEPLVGKLLDTFWQGKTLHQVHYFSVHDYHIALLLLPFYLILAIIMLFLLRKSG